MKKNEIRKRFFQYVFFNILSSLGVSVYLLIDTYFISKGMGADGLAALNVCLPVFNFLNGFGLMLGIGGGSRFSMMYCNTERAETDKIFTNAFYASVLISAVFLLAGLFFSAPLTRLLGADERIFELSHGYLKTVLLFAPAFVLNNLLVCFMRNDCAPRLATLAVLGGSFANVILDYDFIFVMNMGMRGAALATSIAPIVSMAILSIHFLSGWNAFRLRLEKPRFEIIRTIFSLGLPTFVTEVSGGIVILVFNFIIYRLTGNTGLAAYGVIANLAIVCTAVYTGLSSGVQPLLCSLHGKKDVNGQKYLLRLSIVSAFVLAAGIYAAMYLYTPDLVTVFNSDGHAEFQLIAKQGIRRYFLFMPFMGVNALLSVFFMSCELPALSQLISLLRGAVLVIPIAFLFFALKSMSGIWLTVPISEVLTAATGAVIYYYFAKPYEVYVYHYVPNKTDTAELPTQPS